MLGRFFACVVLSGLFVVAPVLAQVRQTSAYTPSQQSGSRSLGVIGGYNTNRGVSALNRGSNVDSLSGNPQFSAFSRPQTLLDSPYSFNYGGKRDVFSANSMPDLRNLRQGRSRGIMPGMRIAPRNDDDRWYAAYLTYATSPLAPIGGFPTPRVQTRLTDPLPDSESAPSNALESFFGVRAASNSSTSVAARAVQPSDEETISYAALLDEQTLSGAQQMLASGLAAFKKGTVPNQPGAADSLGDAMSQLTAAADMDSSLFLPAMLSIHVSMDREQPMAAIRWLFETVRRNPRVFVDRTNVAQYFGDPKYLEAQMRSFVRAAEGSNSPEVCALQAYCAWVLGDSARVRTALDKMMTLTNLSEASKNYRSVAYAMYAALQK